MLGTSFRRYIGNLVVSILPYTRFFPLKRSIWRFCRVDVSEGVSISSGARLFGAGNISVGSVSRDGFTFTAIVPEPASLTIGARCDIAPDVLFECGGHDIGGSERRAGLGRADDICVGEGVWVGARATLLGGVEIGSGTIIGAGAVVLPGAYPPNVLLVGVPARVAKRLFTDPSVENI